MMRILVLMFLAIPCFGGLFNDNGIQNDILISSRPCGKFAFDLNGSSLTSITVNNQYELVCGTGTLYTDTNSWFRATNDVNGNPNRLTYVGTLTHKFFIQADISFVCSADTLMYMALAKNGIIINSSRNHIGMSVTAGETEPVSSTIIPLSTNDYIELKVTTNDSDDLRLHLGCIVAFPVD